DYFCLIWHDNTGLF
nr:immunoglobulin light chain junction region [Macaca mulatta]